MDTLTRIARALFFGVIVTIGLVMALVFTLSTLVALMILYVTAKFRSRPFNAQEYWTKRQSQRKTSFQARAHSRDNITDLEARDVP